MVTLTFVTSSLRPNFEGFMPLSCNFISCFVFEDKFDNRTGSKDLLNFIEKIDKCTTEWGNTRDLLLNVGSCWVKKLGGKLKTFL